MSYPEYLSWIKYANKNGSLDTAKHLDLSLAFIAINFAQAIMKKKSGGSFELSDFTLWYQGKQEDEYGSPEDVFALLQQVAKSSEKQG